MVWNYLLWPHYFPSSKTGILTGVCPLCICPSAWLQSCFLANCWCWLCREALSMPHICSLGGTASNLNSLRSPSDQMWEKDVRPSSASSFTPNTCCCSKLILVRTCRVCSWETAMVWPNSQYPFLSMTCWRAAPSAAALSDLPEQAQPDFFTQGFQRAQRVRATGGVGWGGESFSQHGGWHCLHTVTPQHAGTWRSLSNLFHGAAWKTWGNSSTTALHLAWERMLRCIKQVKSAPLAGAGPGRRHLFYLFSFETINKCRFIRF